MQIAPVVFLLCSVLFSSSLGAHPTGCSLDHDYSSTGIYTCAYGSYTAPLSFGSFTSPYPQRLKITGLTGTFPSSGSAFSGFTSFTSAQFDKNYPASLELECTAAITLTTGTFTGMGYLQEVKFTHCTITTLSNGMLGNFGDLNSLIFQYGSVGTLSNDFLTGVAIQPLSVPDPKGELVFKDCTLNPTTLSTGIFDSQTSAKIIRLENAAVTSIAATVFDKTTKLTHVSITDNPLTTLDNDLFSQLNGLSSADFDGILYDCTCTSLGVLQFAAANSVYLPSDIICNSPTTYQNKKASTYYAETCAPAADTCSGMACTTTLEIIGFVFLIMALVISTIALVLILHSRRQLMTAKSGMEKKRNASWSKVQNAMRATGPRRAKPPMKSGRGSNKGSDGWM